MNKLEVFFVGIFTALGALVFQIIISIISPRIIEVNLIGIDHSMLVVILVEEFFKLAVIWKISQNYTSKKNIILNSFLIGAGFSFVEIFLNILSHSISLELLFSSYFGLFLIHSVTSMILGYYFFQKKRFGKLAVLLVFLLTFFLHLIYNVFVAYEINFLIIYIILTTMLIFLFYKALKE